MTRSPFPDRLALARRLISRGAARPPANAFRVTGYVLAIAAVLLAVSTAFVQTRAAAALLVAAAVLILAGLGALWLAPMRGGTR